jgi:hypothetical protein
MAANWAAILFAYKFLAMRSKSQTMRFVMLPPNRIVSWAIVSLVTSLSVSCSNRQQANISKPARISSMVDSIRFQYAVYLLPDSRSDALAVFRKALTKEYSSLSVADKIPTEPSEMLVRVHLQKNVQQEYAPPNVKSLKYFGNGITRAQALALQRSNSAFILEFGHPKRDVWSALHTANTLVEQIARKTKGLIWDEETR